MRVSPQFYPSLHQIQANHRPSHTMETGIISYAPKLLPIKKSKESESLFQQEEKEDPIHLNHAFRFHGIGHR
jgi:hypothetical protein